MLGRKAPRQPQSQRSRLPPGWRPDLVCRCGWRVSQQPPGKDTTGHAGGNPERRIKMISDRRLTQRLGHVGHQGLQQPGGLARRWQPAVLSLKWRPVSRPTVKSARFESDSLTTKSTGFGQHGDYVFGWEGDSLQRAMDNSCYLRNCSLLTGMAPRIKNLCQVPVTVKEELDECRFQVPTTYPKLTSSKKKIRSLLMFLIRA